MKSTIFEADGWPRRHLCPGRHNIKESATATVQYLPRKSLGLNFCLVLPLTPGPTGRPADPAVALWFLSDPSLRGAGMPTEVDSGDFRGRQVGDPMPLCACGRTTFIAMPPRSRLGAAACSHPPPVGKGPHHLPKGRSSRRADWLGSAPSVGSVSSAPATQRGPQTLSHHYPVT